MPSRFPATYYMGLLPSGVRVCVSLVQWGGASMHWWQVHIEPTLEVLIWPISPAFLIGLLLQDYYNPRSWLWHQWGKLTNKFEIVSLSVGYADDPRRLHAAVGIKFVRPVRHGELVLEIYSCTGRPVPPFHYVIRLEKLSDVVRGEARRIELAKLAIAYPGWTPWYSCWGPGYPGHALGLVAGSKNVAVLRLIGVPIPQARGFFVSVLSYGNQDA